LAGLGCAAWIPLLAAGRSLGALELLAARATPLQARTVPQLIEVGRRIGELIAAADEAPEAWPREKGPVKGLAVLADWRFGAGAPTIRPRA
jgi:hypothetical protein